MAFFVESHMGLTPLRSHGTVRNSLPLYGSSCSITNHTFMDVPMPNAEIKMDFPSILVLTILTHRAYITVSPTLPI